MGAILVSVETKFAVFTLGPPEKMSEISSAFASKKTRSKKEFGRLLCKFSSWDKAVATAVLPSFTLAAIKSIPLRW